MSTIELDLENLALEFPDETLIYMSNKMEIGLDDEKREKEYECFRVSRRNFVNFMYQYIVGQIQFSNVS